MIETRHCFAKASVSSFTQQWMGSAGTVVILSDVTRTFVSGLHGIITSMTMIWLGCQSGLKGGTTVDKMVDCGTRRGTDRVFVSSKD